MPIRAAIACCLFGTLLSAAAADAIHNVLLLCIDDLRPELACYGARYIESPNIDALAARGRLFGRHYVQAPTCGASRYALLTGTYGPYGNEAIGSAAQRKSRRVCPIGFDSMDIRPSRSGRFPITRAVAGGPIGTTWHNGRCRARGIGT